MYDCWANCKKYIKNTNEISNLSVLETQGLLKSFSLKHNGCQLMNTETPAHMLSCLHGLRVVALAWLMLGYRMLHFLASPVFRFKYLTEVGAVQTSLQT